MSDIELKPCPFCGDVPKSPECFDMGDQYKWGWVSCGCSARGPDVRTGYDFTVGAAWHQRAADQWNNRSSETD